MTYQARLFETTSSGAAGPTDWRFRAGCFFLCALLLAFAPTPQVAAQGAFPDGATQVFFDDMESYTNLSQSITWTTSYPYWQWYQDYDAYFSGRFYVEDVTLSPVDNGAWGNQHLNNFYPGYKVAALMVIRDSIPPTGPDGAQNTNAVAYDPGNWENVRIEMELHMSQLVVPGMFWAMTSEEDTNHPPDNRAPADGYVFYLEPTNATTGFRNAYSCSTSSTPIYPDTQVRWNIARLQGFDKNGVISGQKDWVHLAGDLLSPKIPGTTIEATVENGMLDETYLKCLSTGLVYRFRVDYFCGNFRFQYLRVDGDTGTHPEDTVYRGCNIDGNTTCTVDNIDDCWCEMVQGPISSIDESPLEGPGMVGFLFSGVWDNTNSPNFYNGVDNVKVSTFGDSCDEQCDPWLQNWYPVAIDTIPFKFLYEGALFDYSAGRNITPQPDQGKIDIATEAPDAVSEYNHALFDPYYGGKNPYCNGWNLLQGLPDPTVTGGNVGDVLEYLEPMYSAVVYDHNGTGSPGWLKNSGGTPGDPSFNPEPMVTDGSTPINSSLLEAFDWYKEQKTTGAWAADPYEACREWYVILITDGEEACEFENCSPGEPGCNQQPDMTWKRYDPDRVCDPGEGADKFATGDGEVDPLPVYTIGFSQSVTEDSPLKCIAEQTGGDFMTAENATELSNALYNVFYNIEDQARSFSPFKVAPPPSSLGGNNPVRDYLAVYPMFVPQEGQTLWAGNLYGFRLNKSQPLLPTVGDCELDTTQMVWDAASSLRQQLDDHTEANPQRYVFMGSDLNGPWERFDLKDIPSPDNDALQAEFVDLLGVADEVEAQQVANFLRYIYQDNDSDLGNEGPPAKARPDNYPVYGEFFHSQPVVVNPPNSPLYFYDYGFGVEGERGVHNYQQFMEEYAKRRRVVLAGSNDGMLHAIDGGVWDRNRDSEDLTVDIYDKVHDLGDGTELFAYVPQAVMDKLYEITAGENLPHSVPQYTVDGPIVTSDVFIDAVGDSDREWRTVAIASMRRGGRGLVALDITQPDPYGPKNEGEGYEPWSSNFPGCHNGDSGNCTAEYPKILWEFSDETDEDGIGSPGTCPDPPGDPACEQYWDLGWTWSKPAIARIAINNGDDPPSDTFVAFFGGGWDQNESSEKFDNDTPADTSDDFWVSKTGNYLYAVDIESGDILFKEHMDVDVPGGVTALDSDNDGFHDRIYFADTDGSVWRLQYPEPTDEDATGPLAGTFTRIFDFRDDFPDRQEFFTRPIPVPIKFDGSGYTWALALGTGDRSDLARTDTGIDHFFFLVDAGDTDIRTASDLVAVDFTELGTFDCNGTEALVPPKFGWYLSLRQTEKVMFDATVIDGYVQFPTFDPTATVATHRVPDQCGEPPEDPGNVDLSDICYASGLGRTYKLWYECGIGDYKDHTDVITGSEDYTIDDTTYVVFPTSDPEGPEGVASVEESQLQRTHTTTNWRQE